MCRMWGASAPDLGDFEGERRAGLELLGLRQKGGGALGAGEGDHRHGGGSGQWLSGGELYGEAEHLATADGASGHAVAGPFSGDFFHGPAQLGTGGGNGLICPTGTAVEEAMHQRAGNKRLQLSGDAQGRPIEGTAATSHDDQGAKD